jgi:tight adherence protein B
VIFSTPVIIVAGGAILLVGVAIALLTYESARKAKQTRITTLLKAYAPNAGRGDQRNIRAAIPVTTITPAETADKILGFVGVRAEQLDLYPAPWWVILLAAGTVATIGGGLLSAVFGVYGWIGQPIAWLLISRSVFGTFSARRARVLYTQMPDALAMIVRSVRTGLPVAEALRIVGKEAQQPTAIEFERLYNQLLIGTSLTDALISMARRTEVPEYRFFAVALALQGQTGGSLTDTLENLADVIRKRTAMRARAYALSSEARTTVMVLASLPFVAFAALLFMAPQYVTLLIDTTRGRQILATAIVSLLLGIGMMQLMIRRALS